MRGFASREERVAELLGALEKTQIELCHAIAEGFARADKSDSKLLSEMREGFADLHVEMIWMIALLRDAIDRGALRV